MTPISNRRNTGFKLVLVLACIFIVIGGLKLAADFIIPILLGLFLAVLSLPITNFLQKRKVPAGIAVLMAVVLHVAVITGLVFAIISIMPDFTKAAEGWEQQARDTIVAKVAEVQEWWDTNVAPIQTWIEEHFPIETEEGAVADKPFDLQETVAKVMSVNSLISVVSWINEANVIGNLTSLVTKTFFAFILMIFILLEAGKFVDRIEEMVEAKGPNFRHFRNAGREVQRYLGIKTLASIATGALAYLTCTLFNVQFAVLWGIVAFLLNYIPTVGSLVAAIPPVLVALIQLGFWQSLGIMLCYLAINVSIGNFIEPTLLGRRFGISTVVVITSVLFWGWVWGPVGMFLAVPLTMMMKMMMDQSDDFRWVSVAMGKIQEDELDALLEEQKTEPPPGSEAMEPGTEPTILPPVTKEPA